MPTVRRRVTAAERDRPCSRCHQPAGKVCLTPKGNPTDTPHLPRRNPTRAAIQTTGRPSGLTEEVTKTVTDALTLGVPLITAAQAAGIHVGTLHRWLARADSTDEQDAPYRDFRDAVARARAQGQVRHVAMVNQAAQRHLKSEKPVRDSEGNVVRDKDGSVIYERVWEQDWRASAFVLERSYARDFGKREVLEIGASDAVEPHVAAGDAAGAGAGLDGASVDRVLSNLAAFRARKELEEAGGDPNVVEGEVVDG